MFYLSFIFDLGSLGVFTEAVDGKMFFSGRGRGLMYFTLWLWLVWSTSTDYAIFTLERSEVNCDTFLVVFLARVIRLNDAVLSFIFSLWV